MSWPPGSTATLLAPLVLALTACTPDVDLASAATPDAAPPRWVVVASSTPVDLRAIHGTAADDIWAVGEHGLALHWDGSRWSAVPTNTSVDLVGVWAHTRDDAWAVGGGGPGGPRFLRWNGTAWNPVTPALLRPFFPRAVWGSGDDVWFVGEAMGGDPPIYHRDIAGFGPEMVPTRPQQLLGVTASDDDAWTVGDRVISHRVSGNWTLPPPPPSGPGFVGPMCAARGSVWAAVEGGPVLRGNGTTWSPSMPPTSTSLRALWCDRADDVWALDGSARVLHFRGSGWTSEPLPRGDVSALWGVGGELWVVGARGTILRSSP